MEDNMSAKVNESCGDIFQDIGFSPGESEKLNAKSRLMSEIESYIKDNSLTQEQAAKLMGVSRPRISDIVRGKIDKFTIDALIDMLASTGHHVNITIDKAA
jgi:predicted XRE-type DNA-binding protein